MFPLFLYFSGILRCSRGCFEATVNLYTHIRWTQQNGTQMARVSSCTVQIRERRKQYCNKHETGVQHLISQVALFKADNIANENVANFKRGCKKLVFQVTLFKISSVTNKNVTIEWLEKTKRHCKDVIHRADNSTLAIHCNPSLFIIYCTESRATLSPAWILVLIHRSHSMIKIFLLSVYLRNLRNDLVLCSLYVSFLCCYHLSIL